MDDGVLPQQQDTAGKEPQVPPPSVNLEFLWKSPILSGPDLEPLGLFTQACRSMEAYKATHSQADFLLAFELICQVRMLPANPGCAVSSAEWDDFWNARTFPPISILY